MTHEEAQKIFIAWQDYMEINEKLFTIFTSLPESFLPYPQDTLEEALNIMAKYFWDNGNKEFSNTIKETMGELIVYNKDEEAIISMSKSLKMIIEHPELKEKKLSNLITAKEDWKKIRDNKN